MPSQNSVTDRVKAELKKISRYYRSVRCFVQENGSWYEADCTSLPSLIDVNGSLRKGVKVCNERKGKCVVALRGEKVKAVEVKGKEIYLVKEECDIVGKWEKIGYVITGKGEERAIKLPAEGIILLVQEVLGKRPSIYVIYVKEDFKNERVA
jgi:hypothetical protein